MICKTFSKTLIVKALAMLMPLLATAQNYTTVQTTSKKARLAYEDGIVMDNRNEVEKAAEYFAKAFELDANFIEAHFEWAFGQTRLKNHAAAETGFEKVISLSPDYQPFAWIALAQTEYEQDKFLEAAEHAERFLQSDVKNEKRLREARRLAANCRFAAEATKKPVPFEPNPLPGKINSPDDEYLPSITADETVLIFTRLDAGNDENFYESQRDTLGNWLAPKPLPDVNTNDNEGAESISADGTWLVFTACNRRGDGSQGSCDLYWSQQKGAGWGKPQPFSATINSEAWDAQPCISADAKSLIFSSERAASGAKGGKDLWLATRQPGGKWTEPKNLGPEINSIFHEQCPFLHPDGQTLYFTSDGHPGMGGNDLFFARKNPDGTWGKPENLGFPINTKTSEGTLVVSLDGRTAYFAANKPGGLGRNDLYSFELPEFARPKAVTYVKAKVRDAATGKPIWAKTEFVDLASGEVHVSANTKADGTFLVCLPAGKNYALNVSKKDYLFASENFDLPENSTFEKPFLMEIKLQPIQNQAVANPSSPEKTPAPGKPIVLKNVFFETGSAALKPQSAAELDRLAELLKEVPTLKIQINGHTDNVGDDASNLKLSENRAKSVFDFLTKKGIAAERLRFRGFGEGVPVESNDFEDGRAKNRRTEFEVW